MSYRKFIASISRHSGNWIKICIISAILSITACQQDESPAPQNKAKNTTSETEKSCSVQFLILGTSQDAGTPQIGTVNDPAWTNTNLKKYATSAALIDHRSQDRFLFEATPDMREQLYFLDKTAPIHINQKKLGLAGIFLTHAHIGHYAGLIYAGHESAGTNKLPVFAMPRMANFLRTQGPWSQLVEFKNITISVLQNRVELPLSRDVFVTPYQVPHRDEFSETVGYVIKGPSRKVLFLPDIDDWDKWNTDYNISIEDMIKQVDYAFIDATFFSDTELPGRDMSAIPHPRVEHSMARIEHTIPAHKDKVHFIHINHTNPIRYPDSAQSLTLKRRGFHVARLGDSYCLSQ